MRDRAVLVLFILIILLIFILAQNGLLGGLLSGGGLLAGTPQTLAPSAGPIIFATLPNQVLPPANQPTVYMAPTFAPAYAPSGSGSAGNPTPGAVPAGVSSNGQCIVPNGWTAYTVQLGDTLAAIASNYNLTAAQLASANCLQNPDLIYEGEIIAVPGSP